MKPSVCLLLVSALLSPLSAQGLSPLFGDHMVLQRETGAPVWGNTDPGTEVTVTASWPGAVAQTATADTRGDWRVVVRTPSAGGPFALTARAGDDETVVSDVLIGEVWICSGQSNMEWRVTQSKDADAEVAAADHPMIRFFDVPRTTSGSPAATCGGTWRAVSPQTVGGFSAVGYYFGRELQGELGVPVGLIGSNWGGTVAEAWTSAETLRGVFPEFGGKLDSLEQGVADASSSGGKKLNQNTPTVLFNGMIAPLVPFAIRGAIWYQGESNRTRAYQYRSLFPAMIADWRAHFGRGDFPFYFVQIAPYGYRGDTGQAAELREAQAMAQSVRNTGMAVTMDIGNPKDIHPANKQDVGRRLALCALGQTYGEGVEWRGPTLRSTEVAGSTIRLNFDHAAGLTAGGGQPTCFTIAGKDQVFHPAVAVIEGEAVLVRSPAVGEPVAVRFAWGAADQPNLRNAAGLPASSFRTDDWAGVTAPGR